jgi:hypothetical protein
MITATALECDRTLLTRNVTAQAFYGFVSNPAFTLALPPGLPDRIR